MILRILANAPLITKGAELDWEELDGNLIKIYEDLSAKVKAGSIPDFNSATVYSLRDASNYDGRTWLYLNAAPAAGIDPGSDPAYWAEIDPTFFIHEKDKDTMLAKGTADEVTAAALAALVAAGIPDTIFTGGTQTADSTIDQDGFTLIFKDGKFLIGPTVSAAPVRLHVAGAVNGAIIAAVGEALTLIGATGVNINATGRAVSAFGPANIFRKQATGGIPAAHPASLIDCYSPDQGIRILPQHTTGTRDSISSPPPGLEIHNTTLARNEINDPFFGWMPSGYITPDWGIRIHYEAALGIGMFLDNDGGGTWERFDDGVNPTGIYVIKTGTGSGTAYASLQTNYMLKHSASAKMYRASVNMLDLNGGGTDFIFASGLINDPIPSSWTRGVFFLYDAANHGGNWMCAARTSSGDIEYYDSGMPVADGTTYNLKFTIDGSERAIFYINGGEVANIPDLTLGGLVAIQNEVYTDSAGTNKRVGISFVDYIEKFDTPRYVNY